MPNSDLIAPLLFKINKNPLALEAAIMELSENVRGALVAINRNEEFIKLPLAVLMTPN